MNTTDTENKALTDAFETKLSRYIVGIDLGTTNCAVSYVDTASAKPTVQIFSIPQMIDVATQQGLDTLPSFHYELNRGEVEAVETPFRFGEQPHIGVVGSFARDRSLDQPGRSIASAKSWLCNPYVDRTSDILPWGGDDDVSKLSPVEVSRRYLQHIRRCWDKKHPENLLADQDTIVTLPASFDELARRLTIEAAEKAGIKNLYLIEEPQAAFYAWLEKNEKSWTEKVAPGQSILVCDVGGGTTDFTLIRVKESQITGSPKGNAFDLSGQVAEELGAKFGLHRVAVGEHLMLGGDNLDLALAKGVEDRLIGRNEGQASQGAPDRLKPREWDALKIQCRRAKEAILGNNPPAEYKFSIAGSGSKLIDTSKSVTIDLEWGQKLLLQGFFGRVPLQETPIPESAGFQEFGLPYASDPNILKHMGSFLWEHRWAGRDETPEQLTDRQAARPDWILFNGGVLESPQIRKTVIEQISEWFCESNEKWLPGILEGNRLDLAVAQGAAYYGRVRRGEGVRIDAQLAKAYYLQVDENPPKAMCIMPANAQAGARFELAQQTLEVLAGAPVQFPMLVSSTHLLDKPGDIVEIDSNKMHHSSSIHTVLELPRRNQQKTLPVYIRSELTEIGTLQLQLLPAPSESNDLPEENAAQASPTGYGTESLSTGWQLECDTRGLSGSLQNTLQRSVDTRSLELARQATSVVFGPGSTTTPKEVWDQLSAIIGQGRREWEPNLLRELWKGLMEQSDYRQISAAHEARWLNVLGWSLRPGFGVIADDWRVQASWRAVHNKLQHRSPASQSEVIVLWRRISGGFTSGQQKALYQDVWSKLKPVFSGGNNILGNNLSNELIRLVGSLERLPPKDKESVLASLDQGLAKKRCEPLTSAILWAIGRIGTRSPIYAGLDSLVRTDRIETVLKKIGDLPPALLEKHSNYVALCFMQTARLTGDRVRDISQETRAMCIASLQRLQVGERYMQPLVEVDAAIQDLDAIVGDSLPLGFRLSRN